MTVRIATALIVSAILLFLFGKTRNQTQNRTSSGTAHAAEADGTPGAALAAERIPGPIDVTVTSPSKRLEQEAQKLWRDVSDRESSDKEDVIVVDDAKKYQSILGFGGAFTDAACYMFWQLSQSERDKLFRQLFHPSQLGLNVCRTCIGSSDYARHSYSYDEGDPDPELKRFSIDHDRQYILPVLKEALNQNAEMFLFSSPWSPPGWMKANGSMLGGSMRRQYMPAYANYFVKFVQEYAHEGVAIKAVTVQNEVDTDQDGRMPACIWPQEYEVDFVRYHLGPAFEKAELKTQIWMIDHNYNLWGRALSSLEAPDLRKYASAIAWHGYVGDPWRMTTVHDAYPDVDAYWTEGGPDVSDPNYSRDWSKWSFTFTGNLRHWCRALTAWNLALDELGRPNIGPFPCGGLVTINSQTKEITESGQYYALAHYSKFIRRGARRIDSSSSALKDFAHVAFENPNGGKVVVLTNGGASSRKVTIRFGSRQADLELEPDSITTLAWD